MTKWKKSLILLHGKSIQSILKTLVGESILAENVTVESRGCGRRRNSYYLSLEVVHHSSIYGCFLRPRNLVLTVYKDSVF